MAEEDPFGGWNIVVTILVCVCRSDSFVIQRERLGSNEGAVIAVAERVNAKHGYEDRECVHTHPFQPQSGDNRDVDAKCGQTVVRVETKF
jgi:hypothetical protein